MRRFAFIAPLAAAVIAASAAHAQPRVSVDLGPRVQEKVHDLGEREVDRQADRLAALVTRELERAGGFDGAEVHLTLIDLKPNRPTMAQIAREPGLSPIHSLSIGGAEIQVEVVKPDGDRISGRFQYFSHTLDEVRGFTTWQDADRAYMRLASGLAHGRLQLR